ncbi:hypothetical protein HMPREF2863_01590 [Micrococcus sp. HMSC067E09]|uniref:three-helix bundle dimerization domain-containing protein n=1 Tax=Micrococcus sp. HMSC067E09 TaxID=1739367 RepID=UPI0008A6032F|nr:hypothetical protein [Micrococcus sp. HMSC067E09]OFR87917.1 hypothetical protein HMPREF2863_01590 [Micrococcus sp. HMSC067E09]
MSINTTEYREALPTQPNPVLLRRVMTRVENDLVARHAATLGEATVRSTFREVVDEFKATARLYHFMPTLTEHDAERRLREMEEDVELAAA